MERATGQAPRELERHDELMEDLWPENARAWIAFGQMSGGRSVGFGLGPIPLTEVRAWFELRGEPPDWWLIRKVQLIDRAFLAAQQKKQAEQPKQPH